MKGRHRRFVLLSEAWAGGLLLCACSGTPCAYSDHVEGFTHMRLSRNCGREPQCDLSRTTAEVQISIADNTCLASTAVARIDGHTVKADRAGGSAVEQEGLVPKVDECRCEDPRFTTTLERDLAAPLTFAWGGDPPGEGLRWPAADDFLRLAFPDGNPVPAGGRVVAYFSKAVGARLVAAIQYKTASGDRVPQVFDMMLNEGSNTLTWRVPDGENPPGLHEATIEWDRTADGCIGSGACQLSTHLALSFHVRFD